MRTAKGMNRLTWKRWVFLLGMMLLALPMVSVHAQDGQIDKAIVDLTCVDGDGVEVNAGLGKLTVGEDPVIVFKDDDTAIDCAALGVEILLSQLDDATIAALFGDRVGAAPTPVEPDDTRDESTDGDDAATTDDTIVIIGDEPPTVALGTPIEPAENYARECDNAQRTDNGLLIRAFLPAGSYRAVLLPVRFQSFDPIMFVDTGTQRVCNSENNLAREYVVDFTRAGIGSQVYGHNSGSVIEFDVVEGSDDPVEFIFGGQTGATAGASGEFVLILEGARLTPQANQHVYNVTMTDSLFSSDTPFGVITLGIEDVLNPNVQAGVYIDDAFNLLFECEDSGGACESDNGQSLQGTSIVEAAVRTIQGDDLDAAMLKLPGAYLAQGVQEVSFVVSEVNDDTVSREEYVIVFYGGID